MLWMRCVLVLPFVLVIVWAVPAAAWASPEATARARKFLTTHEAKVRPLEVAANLAWWNAYTAGRAEDFEKKKEAQNRIDAALADTAVFAELKQIKDDAKNIDDRVLARAISVLYLTYLEKQVDTALLKEMVAKSNAIEKAFNNFRAKVDGKEMNDNEVRKVLKDSKDTKRRQAVWEASKAVGKLIESELKELVKVRNQVAVKLGFKNYHAMLLFLNEQESGELLKLFDELDDMTRAPFQAAKADIDARLAAAYGMKAAELMPWHYHDPFFQEPPAVFAGNLDSPYAQADILKVCREFYAGIGLPIEDVLARSDLYSKEGKSQHAFCTDIDREGDVRVLANITPNEQWMATMLHELGHSVYSSKNIPRTVPYTLRWESHILTTEGVAMMFERWSKSRPWVEKMGLKLDDGKGFEETGAKMLRNQLLIFSRWCQVMLRFEKSMYEDPDQDLNKLWWDLVERYQGLKRPPDRNAPDYASKIHIVSSPVYYHNYMMGQLFASQVHHAICKEVLNGADPDKAVYVGNKDVGAFMKKKVFAPGRTLDWNALTKHATGENLNPKAFAADFRGK